MLTDSTQRQLATDPTQSFIVQAPAGSGKTEILTQRYLRLLANVTAPEQIIALTFTRKAANEMRERILISLQKAAAGVEPTSSHQQQTYGYAINALSQDKKMGWQLLDNPGRLRIFTIDSLCQRLTQAIPLQEKQIPYARICDKPHRHYLAAAKACLAFAIEHSDYHQPLTLLLQHLDNRQDQLITLFSNLLAQRDQWLRPLHEARMQDKSMFERALLSIEQHELARFYQSIPLECIDELITLSRQLACIENNPESPRFALCNWHNFDDLDRDLIPSLAALLLTTQQTMRKAFDHHVGLKRGGCPDAVYNELKAKSKHLLSQLDATPGFVDALIRVKELPEPEYDPDQWAVLQALFTLLPLLAAHLQLIFSQHNEVDFSAISGQALQALGDEHNPTDLTLYLDNQIRHLLVDEFQDTSIQQFELLTQLVQGFQPDDGRTLFVVGDPMQSIYRFRAAEVGLFLRAKHHGIGPVSLKPLELRCNFRSTDIIVDWVNQHFKSIFPSNDDIESGAVTFHSSDNTQGAREHSFVNACYYADAVEEANALVAIAKEELTNHPDDSIAILVRSRPQLTHIMRALRQHQIPCQGVDIDFLAHLPHLRDVWSLTQALLMPANRLSWLAFLRSPWCGITLSDLHCLANVDKKKSIYSALMQLDEIKELSPHGRERLLFIYNVFQDAFQTRYQQSLVDWIIKTLIAFNQHALLDASQQDDLEQFWLLLGQFEQDGRLADVSLFKKELNKLYSQHVTPSRLQVMTIHKSKGLEFDCVILPGLGAKASNKDSSLLRWLTLPTEEGELLLVSPMKAAHDETCLLYDYLGKLDAQKNVYEQQRLLYVAVTRTKKRLYLLDNKHKVSQGTFRHLLDNVLFDGLEPDTITTEKTPTMPELYCLPQHFYQLTIPPSSPQRFNALTIPNHAPRLLGIVIHELLQWICDNHPRTYDDVPWTLARYQLQTLGFVGEQLLDAESLLKKQIQQLFNDVIGQWLIQKHEQEKNEYELLIEHLGEKKTRIIDRTFCENGIRWVIDFKTGLEDDANHRQQVNEYADLLHGIYPEPISCGLYYLTDGRWTHWKYQTQQISV